jgi:hypothetical protein
MVLNEGCWQEEAEGVVAMTYKSKVFAANLQAFGWCGQLPKSDCSPRVVPDKSE